MQNRQNRQNSRPPYENRDISKIPRRRFLLYILYKYPIFPPFYKTPIYFVYFAPETPEGELK